MGLSAFLGRLFGRGASTANDFPIPWDEGRQSIYAFLEPYARASDGVLPDEARRLPDHERNLGNDKSSASENGASSGELRRYVALPQREQAKLLHRALKNVSKRASRANVCQLYEMILYTHLTGFAEHFLTVLDSRGSIDPVWIGHFGRWLAIRSPDHKAVMLGMMLLGRATGPPSLDILTHLGRHDYFTEYAAGAFAYLLSGKESERAIWDLARRVEGLGRVHCVGRLAKTDDPQIKAWLLREGYRNSWGEEYTAYQCAVGGGILDALRAETIDDALLKGAGDILSALMSPEWFGAKLISWPGGLEATRLYLDHLARQPQGDVDQILVLDSIGAYFHPSAEHWAKASAQDWPEDARRDIQAKVTEIVSKLNGAELVRRGLESSDRDVFYNALNAAPVAGVDPWEQVFQRQISGPDEFGEQTSQFLWSYVLRTKDPARVDRVMAAVIERLDLPALSTGPGGAVYRGSENTAYDLLDTIERSLGRFPGKGWPLIATGLKSPLVKNRRSALMALDAWTRAHWPPEAEGALRAALDIEPDNDVRERIKAVIEGCG